MADCFFFVSISSNCTCIGIDVFGFEYCFRAIKQDQSCVLCDALQRHFLERDNFRNLEAAVFDDKNHPAPNTLELSIQVVLGSLLDSGFAVLKKKPPTRRATAAESLPTTSQTKYVSLYWFDSIILDRYNFEEFKR